MADRIEHQVDASRRAGGRVVRVLASALDRYFSDRCPQHAAGIAYRVLFSIVPLAIVLISIFGLVLGDRELHEMVVDAVVNAVPSAAVSRSDVNDAISAIASPSSAFGLITLVLFAWAATGMMAAIRSGLDVAMHAERSRPMARGKLVDLVLVVATALLVLLTVGATVLDELVQHGLRRLDATTGVGGALVGTTAPRLVALAISLVVVALIYRFVPSIRLGRAGIVAGAVTAAVLMAAISLASGRIYGSVTRLSVVYGSLTTALIFVYSIYLYASALLFGGEVAAAWSAPAEPGGEPVARKLRRALRRLFTSSDPPDLPPRSQI